MPWAITFAHPERLLLLLPVLLVLLLWLRRRAEPSPWRGVVEPALLDHLSGGAGGRHHWLGPLLLAAALVLTVVALAEPQRTADGDRFYQRTSAVQVVLDLSTPGDPAPALDAALRDWLDETRVPQVGLMVVAGTSHEVVPPTPDTALVRRQLQWLDHDSLPEPGLDLAAALDHAAAIFRRAELDNAAVVVIGRGEPDAAAIARLAALAEDGIPVHRVTPDGPEATEWQAASDGQWWSAAEFPDQHHPLPRARTAFTDLSRAGDGSAPGHLGPWLALLVFALALLGVRRGWLLLLPLLPLPLLLTPAPLSAMDWEDEQAWPRVEHDERWRTADQAAMALYREGDYAAAAERFIDPEWRGLALYRDGRYLQAAGAFAMVDSPRAHYNRGNALARANRMGEAISAYETALERDPDHAAARHNRDRINEFLDSRRSVIEQRRDEAAEGRATHHPGPLLQDDPAEFWKRKFELDLRRRGAERSEGEEEVGRPDS